MSPTLIVQSLYLQSRLELITLTYGRVQTAFFSVLPFSILGTQGFMAAINAERSSLPLNESVCGSVNVPLEHLKTQTRRLLRRSLRLPNENGHKTRQGCN